MFCSKEYPFLSLFHHIQLPTIPCLFQDPFGELRGKFHYSSLLKQLRRLKTKLRASGVAENLETPGGGTESEDASSISGSEEDGSPEPWGIYLGEEIEKKQM